MPRSPVHALLAMSCAIGLAAVTPAETQSKAAKSYPSKPINLTISLAPGGAADIIGRALGQRLHEEWAQPIVIENKGGANTQVATGQFVRSPADGYSLLLTPEHTLTVNRALYAKLAYDPDKDFAPIAGLITVSLALVLHPSVPATSIAELVALAKSKPMTFASFGVGSGPHLGMELLQSMTGMKLDPVQYRGAGPALADVIAGHLPMMFAAGGLVFEPWKAGKLRLLGIGSAERLPEVPELPTIDETLPGFRANVWFGLFAPSGTPAEIVTKINSAVQKIMAEPAFKARFMTPNYFEPITGTPEAFAAKIKEDTARWSKVIADAKLSIKQ